MKSFADQADPLVGRRKQKKEKQRQTLRRCMVYSWAFFKFLTVALPASTACSMFISTFSIDSVVDSTRIAMSRNTCHKPGQRQDKQKQREGREKEEGNLVELLDALFEVLEISLLLLDGHESVLGLRVLLVAEQLVSEIVASRLQHLIHLIPSHSRLNCCSLFVVREFW